jgi:hypothetical protein
MSEPATETPASPLYTAYRLAGGGWAFDTIDGRSGGYLCRGDAARRADLTCQQDLKNPTKRLKILSLAVNRLPSLLPAAEGGPK